MAGMCNGLGPEPWISLHRALQLHMVEADDDDPVARAGRIEQSHYPIDRKVRSFCVLDLQHQAHLLALCPVECLCKRWNAGSDKPRMIMGAGIEGADLRKAKVCRKAVAVGRSVDSAVVKNDRLAIRSQHDIDLDCRRTPSLRCLKGWQRVLRVVKAVTPVTA